MKSVWNGCSSVEVIGLRADRLSMFMLCCHLFVPGFNKRVRSSNWNGDDQVSLYKILPCF